MLDLPRVEKLFEPFFFDFASPIRSTHHTFGTTKTKLYANEIAPQNKVEVYGWTVIGGEMFDGRLMR